MEVCPPGAGGEGRAAFRHEPKHARHVGIVTDRGRPLVRANDPEQTQASGFARAHRDDLSAATGTAIEDDMGSEHLTKDEFLAHMGPIRDDIKALVELQREQNGRVAKTETRIAVLEDRSPSRVSASVSAVVSGLVTGLGMWFTRE